MAPETRVRFPYVQFLWGLRPHGLAACPHGLCRGSGSSFFSWGLCPHGLRPAPTDFVVARLRRLRLLSRGRMGCAHCIRPPPLGVRVERGSATFEISLTRGRMELRSILSAHRHSASARSGAPRLLKYHSPVGGWSFASFYPLAPLGVRAELCAATFEKHSGILQLVEGSALNREAGGSTPPP